MRRTVVTVVFLIDNAQDWQNVASKMKWRMAMAMAVMAVASASAGFHHWRTHHISRVQHGFDEAMEHGCFNCHGLGGMSGVHNPGSRWQSVPVWGGGTHMMYVKSETEIREWILDGAPARLRTDKGWQSDQSKALIHMPAYRGRMDDGDLEAIVAYYKAVAMIREIPDEKADQGRDEARSLGCFNCHGPEGRGCMANPGALKGYIPSWDGADFPDLVANDGELKEWIMDGSCKRLLENRTARFFLQREKVQMPAYRGRISDQQLESLIAYIKWLRTDSDADPTAGVKGAKP